MTIPKIQHETKVEHGIRYTRVFRDQCTVCGVGGDPFNALQDLLKKEDRIQEIFNEGEKN